MTMDAWVDMSVPVTDCDLLLQIDTEGAEYETFLSMSETLINRFRIVVAEFHNLHWLWSEPFFSVASKAFEKILQSHACVHLHPNNCCGLLEYQGIEIPRIMEFTFLRKDRLGLGHHESSFPHALDCNNTNNPSLRLPDCWYKD